MQLPVQDFLRLVEKTGSLVFWDTESQGREGDYGYLICGSGKPFGRPARTFAIERAGDDRAMVKAFAAYLDTFDAWVTYYGRGHDVPLVNTRLIRWGLPPLVPKPHLDLYFQVRHKTRTGRRSQAHMLEFLEDTLALLGLRKARKMTVSPTVWSMLPVNFAHNMAILRKRCESDTRGLEALYRVLKPLVRDITR